jgi:hypothetical protein
MHRTLFFVFGFLAASLLFGLWLSLRGADNVVVLTAPGSAAEKMTRWRLTADAGTGRVSLGQAEKTTSPLWTLEPGWFVFVESDRRAWWCNGADGIVAVEFESPDRLVVRSADSLDGPPPEKFIERLGRQRFKKIADAAAESKRRLGIAP